MHYLEFKAMMCSVQPHLEHDLTMYFNAPAFWQPSQEPMQTLHLKQLTARAAFLYQTNYEMLGQSSRVSCILK